MVCPMNWDAEAIGGNVMPQRGAWSMQTTLATAMPNQIGLRLLRDAEWGDPVEVTNLCAIRSKSRRTSGVTHDRRTSTDSTLSIKLIFRGFQTVQDVK